MCKDYVGKVLDEDKVLCLYATAQGIAVFEECKVYAISDSFIMPLPLCLV